MKLNISKLRVNSGDRNSSIELLRIIIMHARTRDKMAEVVHKLTEQRQSQGLSQQNIAEATGMAAPNIARLESCKKIPTMQVLAKYADVVGMEINIEVVPIAKNAAEED